MIKWILIAIVTLSSINTADTFYQSRQWLNLLYYEKTSNGYKSLADGDTFFITKSGKTDPKSEYEAALKLTKAQDKTFRQTFPLRYKTLSKYHNLPYKPLATIKTDVDAIKIVFPNRYMANPASMFGHLFLILKSKHGLMNSDILHYLADTRGSSQLTYITGGLTGRFKGWFLREPYYRKIKDYNYVEDREIISFDLKLPQDKIENLQLHAIELKKSHFDYYFLDENCAFFIGKLLNVVLDQDIIDRHRIVFPSQIINKLYEKELLSAEYRREPLTKLFKKSYNSLNSQEKGEVIDLILRKTNQTSSNPKVLRSFLSISEYLINNQSSLAPVIRHNRIQAYTTLKAQNQAKVRSINKKQPSASPIQSKGLRVDYGFSNQAWLTFQPIYYGEAESFNDLEVKKLNCLSPHLKIHPEEDLLAGITLVEIENITEYNYVLSATSWKINSFVGYQTKLLTNQSIELGRTYRGFHRNLVYGFLGVNLSNYDDLKWQELDHILIGPAINIGTQQQLIPQRLNASLNYHYRYHQNYISAKLSFKAMELFHNISYVKGDDFEGIYISISHIF